MNKRGVTLLELLLSISLISIVLLLLLKVMMSLDNINNNKNYASSDEIQRTEIIKVIEEDFLSREINGLEINTSNNKTVIKFIYNDFAENLELTNTSITYKDTYVLKSKNASYYLCPSYEYTDLDNDYYFVKIVIPVLINGENTTSDDDIVLSFLGLKNATSAYPSSFICSK